MNEQHFNIKTNNSEFAIELFGLDIESFSKELSDKLGDVVIYNVTLLNSSGVTKDFVDIASFESISKELIKFIRNNPNSILYYYCDDMHEVPRNRTCSTPQEFRSKLFKSFFKRYTKETDDLKYIDIIGQSFEDDGINLKDVYMHLILPSPLEQISKEFSEILRKIFLKDSNQISCQNE